MARLGGPARDVTIPLRQKLTVLRCVCGAGLPRGGRLLRPAGLPVRKRRETLILIEESDEGRRNGDGTAHRYHDDGQGAPCHQSQRRASWSFSSCQAARRSRSRTSSTPKLRNSSRHARRSSQEATTVSSTATASRIAPANTDSVIHAETDKVMGAA
jgi:hypothetical protein